MRRVRQIGLVLLLVVLLGGSAEHAWTEESFSYTGLREDIIRYYAKCLAQHGHRLTPELLIIRTGFAVGYAVSALVYECCFR